MKERILALVVEKTGYPKDMLDVDLDLEADLGVDTVKQAEMFAAIREIYNIPRDENRKLRDYPTLGACDSVRVREAARSGWRRLRRRRQRDICSRSELPSRPNRSRRRWHRPQTALAIR